MQELDVAVVGAGVSGLSFAHYAAQAGRDVTVFERAETTGGCLQSFRQEDGYFVELGAHTCYNSYGNLIGILENCGLKDRLLPRGKVSYKMLGQNGEVVSIPSALSFFELLLNGPRIFFLHKPGLSVREYYSAIVGKGNYEKVFSALFQAVPSQPADEFPAEMLFKRRNRRKDILRSFSMEGGLQTITDAMAATAGVKVQTGRELVRLEKEKGWWRLFFNDGSTADARKLALAVPPDSAARLLQLCLPALVEPLEKIRVAAIDSLAVVLDKSQVSLPPVAGLIPFSGREKDHSALCPNTFYSVVSRDIVADERHRGFAFHGPLGRSLESQRQDAARVLRLDPSALTRTRQHSVRLPSPIVGHEGIVKTLNDALRVTDAKDFALLGNYFGGLAIEDCVIRSREEAVRVL